MKRRLALSLLLVIGLGCWSLPPVPPNVDPTPGPDKKVQSLGIVTVDVFLKRTPEQGQLLTDVPYWDSVRSRGHKFKSYEYGKQDAAPYRAAVDAAGGPPAVVFTDASKKGDVTPILVGPLPADKAAMDQLIKKFSDK